VASLDAYCSRTKLQIKVLQRTLGGLSKEELDAIKILLRQLKQSQRGNISKQELCQMYDFSPKMMRFRMKRAKGLTEELQNKFGYTSKRHILSPGEVETIMTYLGTPLKCQ